MQLPELFKSCGSTGVNWKFHKSGQFWADPPSGCIAEQGAPVLWFSTVRAGAWNSKEAKTTANKEPNFFKPQNKLCLVTAEASVSVAKSPCVIHYPFLETGRERLKIITFKKGINTHKKKAQ